MILFQDNIESRQPFHRRKLHATTYPAVILKASDVRKCALLSTAQAPLDTALINAANT